MDRGASRNPADRALALLAEIDPMPADRAHAFEAKLLPSAAETIRQRRAVALVPPSPPRFGQFARRRIHGSRLLWSLRGAAVAVVALAVGLVVGLTGGPPASAAPPLPVPLRFGHGTHPRAVAFLEGAARAIDAAKRPGSGPVLFTAVQDYAPQTGESHGRSTTTVGTTIRQVWYAPDGSTKVREYNQPQSPVGGDVGGPKPASNIDHTGWSDWPDPNRGLPADTAAARESLLHSANIAGLGKQERLSVLKQMAASNLQAGTASPAQAAAIYRVVAGIPDVFDAGLVADRIGRRGHAIGMPMPDPGYTAAIYLIIDPTSGRILQTETTINRPPSALHLPNKPWVDEYHVVRTVSLVPSKNAK